MNDKEALKIIQIRAKRYKLQQADYEDLVGYLVVTNYSNNYSKNFEKAEFEKKIKTLCNKWLKQHNKQRKRQPLVAVDIEDSGSCPTDIISSIESYAYDMPGKFKENIKILKLKLVGYATNDIAEELGMPESTIRWRLTQCQELKQSD